MTQQQTDSKKIRYLKINTHSLLFGIVLVVGEIFVSCDTCYNTLLFLTFLTLKNYLLQKLPDGFNILFRALYFDILCKHVPILSITIHRIMFAVLTSVPAHSTTSSVFCVCVCYVFTCTWSYSSRGNQQLIWLTHLRRSALHDCANKTYSVTEELQVTLTRWTFWKTCNYLALTSKQRR